MTVLKSQLHLTLLDRVTAPARGITATMGALTARMNALRAPLAGVTSQLLALGAGYVGATAGFAGTFSAASNMQAALTEVGIKAGLSNDALAEMQRRLTALSGPTNQMTADLVAAVDVMVGMGLSADEAVGAVGAVGKAATATGATIADLSSATVSVMQNLRVPADQMTAALDAMASAGNNGAFELRAMAQYIPALGAAYQSFGQQGVGAVADLASALQIVRTGTGDEATAANALANLLQKLNAPQTRTAFKKFGVDLGKRMEQATAKGMTPIEAIAEITNETLKGDLSKMGDLFADSEVQRALRPLLQNLAEYRRIRDEANRADGTVADSFNRRMQDANQKIQAFRIRMQNAGAAIGANLLEPIGRLADHLSYIFDTADQRVTVFDRMGTAIKSFFAGLGLGDGGLKSLSEMLFGIAGPDGVAAGEELGRISYKFRQFGESVRKAADAVRNSPIGSFLVELGAVLGGLVMSRWFRLFAIAAGIAAIVSAVQGADSIGAFVENLKQLSVMEWAGVAAGLILIATQAKAATDALRALRGVSAPKGTPTPKGAPAAPTKPGGGLMSWLLGGAVLGGLSAFIDEVRTGKSINPTGDVIPSPAQALHQLFKLMGDTGTPGKYANEAAAMRAEQDRFNVFGGGVTTDTLRQAFAPQGTQDVRVTNPPPSPVINYSPSFVINGAISPEDLARRTNDALGYLAKTAVDGHLGGAPY
ncbi:phage tail tape measure protein [Peteryoungia desertarenae]|uniref:Phage tail tape measure protein n=1 Tax=Peteryoungia desertarenae TaxID=1813451 RepID=A0ABX6QNV7_9HYPH|nr:phage tail tape measure protein [Peteryoungia desertarenae]QLF70184.1 phage tail tape measure protein [Peteryoungia desertarenae]